MAESARENAELRTLEVQSHHERRVVNLKARLQELSEQLETLHLENKSLVRAASAEPPPEEREDKNVGSKIENVTPSRDGKVRRAVVKYQNPDEYVVTGTQKRVTQRTTDRAVRSLVKIHDVEEYILEEDLAHLDRELQHGEDGDADTASDDEAPHHSCQLKFADNNQARVESSRPPESWSMTVMEMRRSLVWGSAPTTGLRLMLAISPSTTSTRRLATSADLSTPASSRRTPAIALGPVMTVSST